VGIDVVEDPLAQLQLRRTRRLSGATAQLVQRLEQFRDQRGRRALRAPSSIAWSVAASVVSTSMIVRVGRWRRGSVLTNELPYVGSTVAAIERGMISVFFRSGSRIS
jgi:hypothetical protein